MATESEAQGKQTAIGSAKAESFADSSASAFALANCQLLFADCSLRVSRSQLTFTDTCDPAISMRRPMLSWAPGTIDTVAFPLFLA